ncbi:MAG TPA: hypothetical protein PLQ35_08945 [bacterium]|nr:hypothetical protein [bacterium]HQL62408.1 hypothetical protein [bacterium]
MKKVLLLTLICVTCFGMLAYAAPKKIALIGRISWCPGSTGSTHDRDFDIMHHFSMTDEVLCKTLDSWGYFSLLMTDYVVQYMLNNGECPFPPGDDADYFNYVNDGEYMMQPTFLKDDGYSLAWVTGTVWSNICPQLRGAGGVPIIMGEHSCTASNTGKIGTIFMFYGTGNGDMNGDTTIQLTAAGKTHPLTAGLPDEIQIWDPGALTAGEVAAGIKDVAADAAPGTVVLAVWKSDPTMSALSVIEAGGDLADGTKAPARMVVPFCNGGNVRPTPEADLPPTWIVTYDYLTPAGVDLTRRMVRWAMGEDPTGVGKWDMK